MLAGGCSVALVEPGIHYSSSSFLGVIASCTPHSPSCLLRSKVSTRLGTSPRGQTWVDMGRGAGGGVVPASPLPFLPGPGAQSLGPRGASETWGRENWLMGGASHPRSRGSKRSVSLVTQIRAQAKHHSGWEGCGPSSCIQLVPQNPLSHLPMLPTHQACPTF